MPTWIVDVLVAVVLTTVEATALVITAFALGIKQWAADKGGHGITPGLKLTVRAVSVASLVLPLACAYGLFLLHLPIAATAQLLLAAAVPFLHPILTGVNRLRERLTHHRHERPPR
ncbi:hypothetical protein ACFWIQ_19470 [Kitasatospora sp. NPDC127059]|uniref:hypothetical protein n=1 Tax=unclassified Kitasatospora TaxID=2633591 RepID=UPI00364A6F2C